MGIPKHSYSGAEHTDVYSAMTTHTVVFFALFPILARSRCSKWWKPNKAQIGLYDEIYILKIRKQSKMFATTTTTSTNTNTIPSITNFSGVNMTTPLFAPISGTPVECQGTGYID
jgi:hypothetical protein